LRIIIGYGTDLKVGVQLPMLVMLGIALHSIQMQQFAGLKKDRFAML